MRPEHLICAAAAISLLVGCSPGKLSHADEEDVSCLLADLAGFSTATRVDPNVRSPLTVALMQSALYRIGRLQGRHGDDDWPRLIDKLDPAVMKVQVADKIQACRQTSGLSSAMKNPKLKAALERMAEAEKRDPGH